jgi:hypothetical protein
MQYHLDMRLVLRSCFLILLFLAGRSSHAVPLAELRDNYQPIIDRNPFGLHPPPPPPTNNPAANQDKKPKTELFLTGITWVGHPRIPKLAHFMTKETEKNNKSTTNYYALKEGVEKDGIKVLSIDEVGRKVRIHTTEEGDMMLSFETHGVAPPVATAPKPGAPGAPGTPGLPIPGQPGAFPVPQPSIQPQPINNALQPAPTTPNNSATRQIPSRRVRAGTDASMMMPGGPLPGGNPGVPNQVQQQDIDPAEQYLRMHLNRAAAEKQGIPQPPLPIINQ